MQDTYRNFLNEFDKTFPPIDVIKVEIFVDKYKTLIERTTNTVIEELDMKKCYDFGHRNEKFHKACKLTKRFILNEITNKENRSDCNNKK